MTLVTHGNRFCDWPSRVWRKDLRPHSSGPLLKSVQTDPPPRITLGPRDSRTLVSAGIPELRGARKHCVWSRSTFHRPCVESLLPPARSHSELVLRLPYPDKRPDWAEDTRTRTVPPGILPGGSAQLEPFPPVGRVCTEFPPPEHHGPNPVPVHTRLPTPALPVDGRAIRGSSCRPLVPSERKSVGLSPHPPPTAVRRHKDFADVRRAPTPLYHPGDRVWLSTRDIWLRLPCKKLSPSYIGPFKIQRQINEVTYRLQLPPRYRIHPTFHVSLLKPCSSLTPDQRELDEPPPPEILDQPSVYQVRNIMDSRRRGGRL